MKMLQTIVPVPVKLRTQCRMLAATFLVTGSLHTQAQSATVWNPTANPSGSGKWSESANWTGGAVPDSTNKVVFNVAGARACWVTNAAVASSVSMGENGPGGTLIVTNGASLSAGSSSWSAVGYNNSATMIVAGGGVANFGNHLWIGFSSGANGTLTMNGGMVSVAGMFGLGWSGGAGVARINGGMLNLAQWNSTQSISGPSVLDVGAGTVVIAGKQANSVADYVAAGKIIAYGGTGSVVWDYDISNPGKTTIKAIQGQIPTNWRVASTLYSTNEMIITPFDAFADFGICGDGVTDVTDRIQTALILLGNMGGGTLFLPAGHYKVSGNLNIPSGVTMRGDWRKPEPGQALVGTVLQAYAGRGNENAAPFIKLNTSAGVNGVAIWYPEQLPENIRPYPPTLGNGGGATVENVTLVNPYIGFTSYVDGTTARPFLRGIYGTPLRLGIEFDCLADIGRIETVRFSPNYWKESGLPNAPTDNTHAAWIYNNGTGMIVRRIDWSYSCYVTVEGYNIGLALRPGRVDGKYPNGQSYGFNLVGCKTGIYIEASAYAGYQFTRFNIQQAETGVYLSSSASEANMFHTCAVDATNDAIYSEGTARILMMSCDIEHGTVRLKGGYLSVINSDFGAPHANHIELGGSVRGASILGNRFSGGPRIIANTSYPVSIDHAPLTVEPLPAYSYAKPPTAYGPDRTNLYVVTKPPYNAQTDGVTDATTAFQGALSDAGANGGGTVFVPGGNYRLNGTLIVPTGVELRGVFDIPHGTETKGSLLNVYSGRNNASGTPFVQLQPGAGIKGITFHYPEQIYDALDPVNFGMVPYPFLIRGLGSDVYIVNLAATIPYQLLDLAGFRCDRHYVDYILSTALKTGIQVGKGAVDGQIHNCQFNPSAYTHQGNIYDSIPTGTSDNIHKILWRDATPYRFGHMTNEVLHENFVFGGAKGFHLVPEGGFGPSGHSLGMGVDQCTVAMQIDDVGDGGLAPINSQIVTVNSTSGYYLQTGSALNETFSMFSSAGWGSHANSAVINGGDVRLQLFHVSPAASVGAFKVLNGAHLLNLCGNLRDNLPTGRPFLTVSTTASADIIGNVINTSAGQMPVTSGNVTSLGNLRVGASPNSTDRTWSNGGGNRAWSLSSNWSGEVVPGVGNRATIANQAIPGPIVSPGTLASVKNLVVGDLASSSDRIDMNGGSLTVSEWLILGYETGNEGTLAISNGTANVGGDLFVGLHGSGAIEMTGGSLTVAGRLGIALNPGSTGRVAITAGNVSVASLAMTAGGSVDIIAGTLLINGDARLVASTYISNGWITALGGTATPFLDYNNLNPGKTTIGVVVPPLTTTVWNSAVDNFWTSAGNWTGGSSPIAQIQNLKVVFNVGEGPVCILNTNAIVAQLSMGDNGATSGNALTLTAGANLTCGLNATNGVTWTGIGYNRPATMTVQAGGELNCRDHLWIGFLAPSVGTLDIQGGTVNVSGQLGLGWSGGTGYVNVRNGGKLNLKTLHPTTSISGSSIINLESGSVVIEGNQTNAVNNYVAAGKITAYNGAGLVAQDFSLSNAGKTTLTALPPPPQPQMLTGVAVSGGNVTLTYQTTAGHIYHIEASPDLSSGPWVTVPGSTTNATGAPVTFVFPSLPGSNSMFYRTVSP